MGVLLLGAVTVTVEPIDNDQAVDALAREGTLRKKWKPPFTLLAQLDYAHRSTRASDFAGGGDQTHRAELTIDAEEAAVNSWSPAMGDRVKNATDRAGNVDPAVFYVAREIPRAYWFGGVSTTRVLELTDRFPTRRAED